MVRKFAVAALALLAAGSASAGQPADPLGSPMWTTMAERFFGDAPVVMDERVKVEAPSVIENQAQVPVTVDATALQAEGVGPVERVVVFADLNPIQHVLTLEPVRANAYISFRMKLEQASPVRAGVLTADGIWHVGSRFVETAGGGCTSPAMARRDEDWSVTLGRAQGRLWPRAGGVSRVRLRVRHPMDTGLAKGNIPAFYIERLAINAASGTELARLEMFEPVGEDPTVSLDVRLAPGESGIATLGRDNDGSIYRSVIPAIRPNSSVRTTGAAPASH